MNSILLLLALGSVHADAPVRGVLLKLGMLPASIKQSRATLVYQSQREIDWPKVDPRDPVKSNLGAVGGSSGKKANASGQAPAIRSSQLETSVPTYREPIERESTKPSTRSAKPAETTEFRPSQDDVEEPIRGTTGRSKFSEGDRPTEVNDSAANATSAAGNSRFGDRNRRHLDEEDHAFQPTTRLKTSAMRQTDSSLDAAPNPFRFRSASGSDDPEGADRMARYESFAIGAGDEEDHLGVTPYDAPIRSARRDDENFASNRGDPKDVRNIADDGDSTLQGGKKMPGNGTESSMYGSLILVLLLFASMGGNLYLAWVAREFYERYRSLAQQVRSARNNLT